MKLDGDNNRFCIFAIRVKPQTQIALIWRWVNRGQLNDRQDEQEGGREENISVGVWKEEGE